MGEIKKEEEEGQFKDDRASHAYQEHVNMKYVFMSYCRHEEYTRYCQFTYKFREVYKSHIFTTHLILDWW